MNFAIATLAAGGRGALSRAAEAVAAGDPARVLPRGGRVRALLRRGHAQPQRLAGPCPNLTKAVNRSLPGVKQSPLVATERFDTNVRYPSQLFGFKQRPHQTSYGAVSSSMAWPLVP